MGNKMMSGADLRGAGGGGMMAYDQAYDAEEDQVDGMVDQGMADGVIPPEQAVLELAKGAGYQGPDDMSTPESAQAIIDFAMQNPQAMTDGGISAIETLVEQLGLPSPYEQVPGAPDYARGME